MKNLLVLFVFVSGFAMNQLQAQCTPCPPGCTLATCLPDGSCKVTDAKGNTTICKPQSCTQAASACKATSSCKGTSMAETAAPQPNADKLAADTKLVATRRVE